MKGLFFAVFIFLTISVTGQQLAFPGAVGFGRFAEGGRNGTVYRVTNLNDSGAGSLRDAISQSNRIVVFDVAGVINIKSRLVFPSNVTIAGQTAPGEGIVIYGNGVSFSGANNIIVRNIAFRMGVGGDSGKDAAGIANGSNMIFDHCSFTWGRDETFSINWDNKGAEPRNITIQNSIIGQGLLDHSAGGLMQTNGGVTLFRNLYIDNHTRNPKVKGLNQFVNNVVYNWGGGGCYILGDSEGSSWATIVNNYFINGPSNNSKPFSRANNNFQLYADGNYHDSNKNGVLDGVLSIQADYGPVLWVDSPDYWENIPDGNTNKIPQMHPQIPIQMSAQDAYSWIVDSVGKILPARDLVDKFLIDELISLGTKGEIISSEKQLPTNGPGIIFNGPTLLDTDNDGIPDVYEDELGTDKNVNDAMTIGADGYANIERYINMIKEPMPFLKHPINFSLKGITHSSIKFAWSNYEEKNHQLIVEMSTSKNSGFTQIAVLDMGVNEYEAINLDGNTTYYFRLKAINEETNSDYSETYERKTQEEATVPVKSINLFPENNAVDISFRELTLSWENSTSFMGGLLTFDVFLGKSENNLEKISDKRGYKYHNIESLEQNTKYYWQVRAENVLGESFSDVWSFTTAGAKQHKLLLHIPFDEGEGNVAKDVISQTFAQANNFQPQWSDGKINSAMKFSASSTDANVKFAHSSDIELNNQSFTISLWFKSDGDMVDAYFLHKGMFDTVHGGNGKWIGVQYKKGQRLTFAIDDDIIKTDLNIADSEAKEWFDNKWHQLVCIRDVENSELQIYVDGELKASREDLTTQIGVDTDLIIGNCDGYYNTPFKGEMDDFRIYDSALKSYEVAELFDVTSSYIKDSKLNKNVIIHPNPFKDFINIDVSTLNFNFINVNIVDLGGNVIYNGTFNNQNVIKIDMLEKLHKGLYICTLKTENEVISLKLIH